MFPTSGDEIYRNDAGEVTGWSKPADPELYYCDDCGFNHVGACERDYDVDEDDDRMIAVGPVDDVQQFRVEFGPNVWYLNRDEAIDLANSLLAEIDEVGNRWDDDK